MDKKTENKIEHLKSGIDESVEELIIFLTGEIEALENKNSSKEEENEHLRAQLEHYEEGEYLPGPKKPNKKTNKTSGVVDSYHL